MPAVRQSSDEAAAEDGETADPIEQFVALNRRRLRGEPLGAAELARWGELRDGLAERLGASPPDSGRPRRALRVRTHLKLLVTTQAAQELLHAHELSEAGLFVVTTRPPAPGTPLQLELQDRAGRLLELEGSVAWVRREADACGPAGMGIALHALSDRDRLLLGEFVEAALESLSAGANGRSIP